MSPDQFARVGFRVSGSGCRVSGSEFRVLGSGFQDSGSGFWVPGLRSRVPGLRFRVSGSVFRDPGSGFRVPDLKGVGAHLLPDSQAERRELHPAGRCGFQSLYLSREFRVTTGA